MRKVIFACFVIFIVSCSNTSNETIKEIAVVHTDTVLKQESDEPAITDSLCLDEGKKWTVKPEMMVFLRNMETEIKKLDEMKNQKRLNDYQTLGKSLQKNIDGLTSNCTMEGKAHDELHKWLLPYIDLVDQFNESKTVDEAGDCFQNIKKSFVTFNKYFE